MFCDAKGEGFNLDVSDPRFDDFGMQLTAATQFLDSDAAEIERLLSCGNISVSLDFSLDCVPNTIPSARWPSELISKIGHSGVGLELTIYQELQLPKDEKAEGSDTNG